MMISRGEATYLSATADAAILPPNDDDHLPSHARNLSSHDNLAGHSAELASLAPHLTGGFAEPAP